MIEIIGKNGSGKTFLLNELYKKNYEKVVGYTTRKKRLTEQDTIDYYFISKTRFIELVEKGFFVDYKFRNGNYYGIPINQIKHNSILVAGNSELIEEKTDVKVSKVYIDTDIDIRYKRVRERKISQEEIFYRFHDENYSFLDNFNAMYIINNTESNNLVEDVESSINDDGTISKKNMESNMSFLLRKVENFEIDSRYDKNDKTLLFLAYEEYLLRCLFLKEDISNSIKYNIYCHNMEKFMNCYSIAYNNTHDSYIVNLDNNVYNVDKKIKRMVKL